MFSYPAGSHVLPACAETGPALPECLDPDGARVCGNEEHLSSHRSVCNPRKHHLLLVNVCPCQVAASKRDAEEQAQIAQWQYSGTMCSPLCQAWPGHECGCAMQRRIGGQWS